MGFADDLRRASPDASLAAANLAQQPLKPDQAAEAANIARKVGAHPLQVGQDLDGYRRQAQQQEAEKILSGSALLSQWLQEQENAGIVADDLKPLSLLERMGRADFWQDRGRRVAQGAGQMFSAVSKGAALFQQAGSEAALDGVQGRIESLLAEREVLVQARDDEAAQGKDVSGYDQHIARLNKEIDTAAMQAGFYQSVAQTPVEEMRDFVHGERLEAAIEEDFGKPDPRLDEEFTAQVASGFGQLLGMIGTALTPGVGPYAAATQGVALGSVDLYEDAVANGADEETALQAAGFGALIGTTEIGPFLRALEPFERFIPGFKGRFMQVADRVARSAGEEALQEGLQTTLENLTAMGFYDPERGAFDGVAMAMAVGGVIGGTTGAVGAGRKPRQVIQGVVDAQTAARTQEKLQAVDEAVAQSKLKERDPEAFRRYAEKIGLADISIAVPADALNEYFQGNVPADALKIGQDVFSEALTAGNDVHIPMSVYVDKISGTESAAWFQENGRLPDEAMSLSDAQKFNDAWQEEAMRIWEEVEAQELEDLSARDSDVQVQDAIFTQLRAAGRSPDVAQRESQLWGAFFPVNG